MKKLILIPVLVIAAGCSLKTSGELDLGSQIGDQSYHVQSESLTSGDFSYVRMDLESNGSFKQTEATWDTSSSGSKCVLEGTWEVPDVDVNGSAGNELVVSVTAVNGNPVTLEKRYDLRELSVDSVKVKYAADESVVDMTNTDYVEYPEYSALNTSSLTDDDFCDR